MKSMVDELNSVPVRKTVKTTIEYDCKKPEKEDEVFDAVRDIVTNHLDDFSKITYDLDPTRHTVKVELNEQK
ncbi:hypothetical protein [Dubosiella newyorkensis]|jgi:hypothetical protein|uniref:Uncharacterized protein n=1 Tax=Dubosiella newyorkensis TaxID=1862672 RepID=A0A1U7NKL0_9FIRM|nr:hypothetical protein [Dubosiella newyorkensis]MCI9041502.1 hypothetical protein [Dubosiella newyorkensis]OLU44871.1 hypothetical protein BO225_09735 [Dubosiella newyorkensis]